MNPGLHILTPNQPSDRLPLLISGAGRSGTTCLCRCCSHVLRSYHPPRTTNAEDAMSAHWTTALDYPAAVALREDRTADAGPAWLTKVPQAVIRAGYIDPWTDEAANYSWAIIVRDIAACASAEQAAGAEAHLNLTPADNLTRRLNQARAVLDAALALADRDIPVALVSSEKLLTAPVAVLSALWTWLNLTWSAPALAGALAEIHPHDDPRYYK